MPTNEELLLDLLHSKGPMGNGKARETLQWSEPQYEIVKASLLAQGLVATGKGRGGSLRLAEAKGLEANPGSSPGANSSMAAEPLGTSASALKPDSKPSRACHDSHSS